MPALGISHYNLRAPRAMLDELRDFYVTVVGLRPGYRPPFKSFGYWLYAGEQAVLHLSEASVDEVRRINVAGTFDHVAFSCSDLPAFEAHLQECMVSCTRDQVPATRQRQLFFSDPAGNGVELNFAD